jgi:glutamine amidotransferase
MCRQLVYLGPPVSLAQLLLEPEWSLARQSYEPRHQRHGIVNADGFGVGWYDRSVRTEPALYRRAVPIWADASFASVAGVVRSGAVAASVRSATPPSAVDDASTPPFAWGQWLFALNGRVDGFRSLRSGLSAERAAELSTGTDTETLFALVLDRLDRGLSPAEAIGDVVRTCGGERVNLVLTDGVEAVASAWGESLFVRTGDGFGGVVVASEPFDDGPGWEPVPDRSLVRASAESIGVEPL